MYHHLWLNVTKTGSSSSSSGKGHREEQVVRDLAAAEKEVLPFLFEMSSLLHLGGARYSHFRNKVPFSSHTPPPPLNAVCTLISVTRTEGISLNADPMTDLVHYDKS